MSTPTIICVDDEPIVLDNVVMISAMEKRIERMLQTLQVSIEGQHHHPPK